MGHLDKNKQTSGIGIFQIKQTLSKLKKDDACRLADACADWLGKTLCNGAFQKWRSGYKSVSTYRLSQSGFQLSVESNFAFALVLHYYVL